MNAFPWGELAGEMAAAAVGTAASFSPLFCAEKILRALCCLWCHRLAGVFLFSLGRTFVRRVYVRFRSCRNLSVQALCGLGALSGYPVYDSRYFPYCSRSRHLLDCPLHCHRPAGAGKPHGI